MKKTWQAPRLIILVRSTPQEAILNNCKYYLATISGPGNENHCYNAMGTSCVEEMFS